MNSLFKNILVPVDLTVNTQVAVKKAIDLADANTTIHLLYVNKKEKSLNQFSISHLFLHPEKLFYHSQIVEKVNQWKNSISENRPSIKTRSCIISNNSVQQAIVDQARDVVADLIIIGKNVNHSWLPFLITVVPNQLAKETCAVVLTVRPGGIYTKVKTMVVPVTNEHALNKLALIYAICKKFPVNVRLVTFKNYEREESKITTATLLELYQTLRVSLHCKIEHTALKTGYRAKAILDYAEQVNADMILVDPNSETKIGWPNKYISDILPAASKLQVWAV